MRERERVITKYKKTMAVSKMKIVYLKSPGTSLIKFDGSTSTLHSLFPPSFIICNRYIFPFSE